MKMAYPKGRGRLRLSSVKEDELIRQKFEIFSFIAIPDPKGQICIEMTFDAK